MYKLFEASHIKLYCFSVLTNLGEKLSEAEVEDLLKDETIDDNGSINYHGQSSCLIVECRRNTYISTFQFLHQIY